MQSKYAVAPTRQARLTAVNGTICCPGPRWRVRLRPPDFGGYPFVARTRRAAPPQEYQVPVDRYNNNKKQRVML